MTEQTGSGRTNERIEQRNSLTATFDRRTFVKTAAAGATGVSLAGCLGGNGSGDGMLTFGGIFLRSGFASVYGESAERGIEMAVEEINEDGGIDGREVEVLLRDGEGSPDTAIRHAQSFVDEDEVDGLIGLDSSGVALQVAPLMEQLQTPFIITHAATPYVTAREGDRAVGNDYVFRASQNLAQNIHGAAHVAADLDGETWTTVGPDYAFGHDTWDYFRAFMNGMGADVEFLEDGVTFPGLGSDDFTPHIRRLQQAEPDGVITSLWGGDLITFIDQAKDAGFFDTIDHFMMTVGAATDVLGPMGDGMPDGLWAGTRYWFLSPDSSENQTFREAFSDRYDRMPSYNAEGAYRGMYLYKQAIEENGSADADDIVDALKGREHTGPVGSYRINAESNQATLPANWGQTTYSDEYEMSVLDPVEHIDAPADDVRSLLEGTDLPAGI